jgi:hypothetical protein
MAFDREHVLLTWGGELPGKETWTCSLRCAPTSIVPGAVNISDGDLDGLMASYVPAVKAFHARASTKIFTYASLLWVKAAAIDQNGKYKVGQVSVKEEQFAAVNGGGTSPGVPNQVALAVSLTTALPRGYGHAGRFYLPMPTTVPDASDGLITTGDADSVRGSVKTFLESIADVPGIDTDISPEPVVMSRHGSGSTHKITGCKIGRVLDTQRRRRRSLPENYRIVAIDTGTF